MELRNCTESSPDFHQHNLLFISKSILHNTSWEGILSPLTRSLWYRTGQQKPQLVYYFFICGEREKLGPLQFETFGKNVLPFRNSDWRYRSFELKLIGELCSWKQWWRRIETYTKRTPTFWNRNCHHYADLHRWRDCWSIETYLKIQRN